MVADMYSLYRSKYLDCDLLVELCADISNHDMESESYSDKCSNYS